MSSKRLLVPVHLPPARLHQSDLKVEKNHPRLKPKETLIFVSVRKAQVSLQKTNPDPGLWGQNLVQVP